MSHVSIGGWPALLDPSSFWESRPKLTPARGKPMPMLHFFFKSITKLKFRRGSIYIYIYIYIYISIKKNNSTSSLWGKKIIAVFFFFFHSL